ncbi:hypothetical protein AZI85_09885 [Bdellovibrio bacteriovorus]|uniref:Uncharacterized protein n=1 Tax=Bdellovibrio bacteriovorus TaxID=959 RepID=A0A150WEA1_BDEBC|nr:hypothetical protein [Bdellovibrio bacteriovorus]KYG61241.1 hypothetical protein AZI85_09885 [Bdellovibrio bacteriovorus]
MRNIFSIIALVIFVSSTTQAFSCGDRFVDFAKDQIIIHITKEPNAADTVEGIHYYWIDWGGLPESIVITQASLNCLKDHGVMESFKLGNNILWRKAR